MTDFTEFYEFDTAVLAAVERDDPAAACELVLAAADFRRTVQHLRTLPEDARRRLAHTCIELYLAAEPQERRDRIRTVHAGLLARRVDLLETDGFEASVLATMHSGAGANDGKRVVLEGMLASAEFPRLVDRLRTLAPEYRRRLLTDHMQRSLYRHSEDPQWRERVLWLYTVLRADPVFVKQENALALVREAVEHSAPAECAAVLKKDSLTHVARELAALPRDVRRRLDRHCAELLEAAGAQERREPAIWMRGALTSGPLKYLDYDELEPMLLAAGERGDAAAACEMVVSDTKFRETCDKLPHLPEEVRRRLVEACVELHETTAAADLRYNILRMHALLAKSLGNPDDRLATARQEALRLNPEKILRRWDAIEMVWVELNCGRDIPLELCAELRRDQYSSDSSLSKDERRVVRLLTGRPPVLHPGEPWSDRALADLAHLPAAWAELVKHAVTVPNSRPSPAWEKDGRALLAEIDEQQFGDRALSWLGLLPDPRTLPQDVYDKPQFDAFNYQAARGLVWLLASLPEGPDTVHGLSAVMQKALRTVAGSAPGMPKLANACAMALCRMDGEAALAETARLADQVTYKPTLKLLEDGLTARAQALGLDRSELGKPAANR